MSKAETDSHSWRVWVLERAKHRKERASAGGAIRKIERNTMRVGEWKRKMRHFFFAQVTHKEDKLVEFSWSFWVLQPWRVGVFRGRFYYWLCSEIVLTFWDLFVVYPIYCEHKFLRPPPRPHVAPLFPRGAMVRLRKFWKLTEKRRINF